MEVRASSLEWKAALALAMARPAAVCRSPHRSPHRAPVPPAPVPDIHSRTAVALSPRRTPETPIGC